MKKLLFPAALLCLTAMFFGCATSIPEWVNNPPDYEDAIAAVGTAMFSENTAIMRRQAEFDGRASIARVIGTRVEELIKNWAQQNQSSLYDKAAFDEYFESVARGITAEDIVGVEIDKWFLGDNPKAQYALAVFKRSNVAKVAQAKMEAAKKNLEEQQHEKRLFTSREKANVAFEELDKIIEREFSSAQ